MCLALLWNFYLLLLNSLSIISGEIFMAVQREEQKRSNTQKNMASIKLTFLPESPDISGLSGF
jgi:hypothetical protein